MNLLQKANKTNFLKEFLEQLRKDWNQIQYLASDPLEIVHRYQDPWDQEAVALLCSCLAYGRVEMIRSAVENLLERTKRLGFTQPKYFIQKLECPSFQKKAFQSLSSFQYRFNIGSDIVQLLIQLQTSWKTFGSLGGHFLHFMEKSSVEEALNKLLKVWKNANSFPNSSYHYFLASPDSGSCCKRWCMMLRWMGRKDLLDLGLWTQHSPMHATFPKNKFLESSQLFMPLDTHTGKLAQFLGFTSRKTLNWKAVIEVTENLKKLSPLDPIRYDFALSRLGILEKCKKVFHKPTCEQCQIEPVCLLSH